MRRHYNVSRANRHPPEFCTHTYMYKVNKMRNTSLFRVDISRYQFHFYIGFLIRVAVGRMFDVSRQRFLGLP